MDIRELTAPCGLYCASCPLYLASKDEKMAEAIANKFNIPVKAARCLGCRPTSGSPTPFAGKTCGNFSCAEEKGHFTCVECADFPCIKLAPAADKADMIPHNTKLYNLLLIKKKGLEAWAKNAAAVLNLYYKGAITYGEGPKISE